MSREQLEALREVLERDLLNLEAELHVLFERRQQAALQLEDVHAAIRGTAQEGPIAARNVGERSKGQQRRDAADRVGTESQATDDDFEPR